MYNKPSNRWPNIYGWVPFWRHPLQSLKGSYWLGVNCDTWQPSTWLAPHYYHQHYYEWNLWEARLIKFGHASRSFNCFALRHLLVGFGRKPWWTVFLDCLVVTGHLLRVGPKITAKPMLFTKISSRMKLNQLKVSLITRLPDRLHLGLWLKTKYIHTYYLLTSKILTWSLLEMLFCSSFRVLSPCRGRKISQGLFTSWTIGIQALQNAVLLRSAIGKS